MSIRSILAIMLFCTITVDTEAQTVSTDSIINESVVPLEKKQNLGKRLNTKLTNKYYKTKYDTNYVARPKEKWLFRLLGNQTGNYIHAKGTVKDVYSEYDLHTKTNNTLGLEVNYCDIAATISVNPAKIGGDYNDMKNSVERLTKLDVVNIYPGHGPIVEKNGKDHIKLSYSFL